MQLVDRHSILSFHLQNRVRRRSCLNVHDLDLTKPPSQILSVKKVRQMLTFPSPCTTNLQLAATTIFFPLSVVFSSRNVRKVSCILHAEGHAMVCSTDFVVVSVSFSCPYKVLSFVRQTSLFWQFLLHGLKGFVQTFTT